MIHYEEVNIFCDREPWLVGKDVAEVLGHKNTIIVLQIRTIITEYYIEGAKNPFAFLDDGRSMGYNRLNKRAGTID